MDPFTAYHKVRRSLEALGYAQEAPPNDEFFAAWQKAEEIIGPKAPKQPGDVCEHGVLLPFLLAMRLMHARSSEAFLFGYRIDCPYIGAWFRVMPDGAIYHDLLRGT